MQHRHEYWIEKLQLLAHPEGGYYKETYRSSYTMSTDFTAENRNLSTAIYFLLPSHQRSLFHRIKSDEIWHFHVGSSIHIYILDEAGLRIEKVGLDIENGEQPQLVVPANSWFGAFVPTPDTYALCSCTVAPGFDFSDFEIAKRTHMMNDFPTFEKEIMLLTKAE
jgi:predicted cupin superfamily sugar epimerase